MPYNSYRTKEAASLAKPLPIHQVLATAIIQTSVGAHLPEAHDKLVEIMTLLGVACKAEMELGEAGRLYRLIGDMPKIIRDNMGPVTLSRSHALLEVLEALIKELGEREPDPVPVAEKSA